MFDPRILFAGMLDRQDQSFRNRPGRGPHNAITATALDQIRLATTKAPSRRELAHMRSFSRGALLVWQHHPDQLRELWFDVGEEALKELAEQLRTIKRKIGAR